MISFFGIIEELRYRKEQCLLLRVTFTYLVIYKIILSCDLMNGKFLIFEEIRNKFEINVKYLHYFHLIAAIPPDFKGDVTRDDSHRRFFSTTQRCNVGTML